MPTHIQCTDEYYKCKSAAAQIRQTLSKFCTDNNLHFFPGQSILETSAKDNFTNTGDKKSLVMLHIHDLLMGDIDYWQRMDLALSRAGKKLLVCSESFVQHPQDFANVTFVMHPALLGLKHLHIDTAWWQSLANDHKPSKLFNCFTHRVEPVRQSWFYFLHNRQLLDKGYVSFLFFNWQNPSQSELDLFDQNHERSLNQLDHFNRAYQELRSQVPYKNFEENFCLWDKICDSKYSLVMDTYAPEDDQLNCYISEKVARVMMLPTLDLLFVQSGTLDKLASLGFEMHTAQLGIDAMTWQQRQMTILDHLDQDQGHYDFDLLLQRAKHNYNVFKKCYSTIDTFYEQVFDLAVSK